MKAICWLGQAGASAAVCILFLAVFVFDDIMRAPSQGDVDAVRRIAVEDGASSVVSGRGPRLVVVWRYVAAGEHSRSRLAGNPELVRRYVAHHDWIFRGQRALLAHFGRSRLRCFSGGARGGPEAFLPAGYAADAAARAERLASAIGRGDESALDEMFDWLRATDFAALDYVTAQSRFAHSLLVEDAWDEPGAELLAGVDPYWRIPVAERNRMELEELLEDAQADESTFLRVQAGFRLREEGFRYSANVRTGEMLQDLPPGIVCSILVEYDRCDTAVSRCAEEESLEIVLPDFVDARFVIAEHPYGELLSRESAFNLARYSVADLKALHEGAE